MITWCRVWRCLCLLLSGLDFPWCLRRQIRLMAGSEKRSLCGPSIHAWIAWTWTDLDWFGLIWTDLDWFGLIWTDLDWFGLIWTDLDWFGLIWTGWRQVSMTRRRWFSAGLPLTTAAATSPEYSGWPQAHRCAKMCKRPQSLPACLANTWQILGQYLAKWCQMSTAKNEAAKSWMRSVGSAKMWYTPKPSNYSWKDTMGFTQCSVSLCKPFSLTYSYSQLLDWLHMWPGWYPCSAFRNGGNDLDCTVLWTVLPSQFIPTSYRLQTSAAESVWIWGETQCWTDRSTSAAPATSSSELRELVLLRCSLR